MVLEPVWNLLARMEKNKEKKKRERVFWHLWRVIAVQAKKHRFYFNFMFSAFQLLRGENTILSSKNEVYLPVSPIGFSSR